MTATAPGSGKLGEPAVTVPARSAGARLGAALLAYVLVATLVITLVPFQFSGVRRFALTLEWGWRDLFANIVLFIPLGFLYRIARPARDSVAVGALVAALAISTLIELLQLFEPGRIASLIDILSNGLGAWLGALGYDRLAGRSVRGASLVGRMALEVPLMGLVYLLLPLLWLDSFAVASSSGGFWLATLLGVLGAGVIGTLQRQLFSPAGVFRSWETALLAVIWFVVGAYPALWDRPLPGLVCLTAVGLIVFVQGSRRAKLGAGGKRFEVPVVRWVIPAFLVYMVLLALWFPVTSLGRWTLSLGFDLSVAAAGTSGILRLLEYVGAFTMLGYMLAELGGRREEGFVYSRLRILRVTVPLALLLEALRGFHPAHGASLILLVLTVLASLYGGLIYHLARAHARELRRLTGTG